MTTVQTIEDLLKQKIEALDDAQADLLVAEEMVRMMQQRISALKADIISLGDALEVVTQSKRKNVNS